MTSPPSTTDVAVVRVLMVDDDQFAFSVLETLVPEMQTPVKLSWVGTYDAGMEALRRGDADVCLLDYQLGDQSGLDFLDEALRRGVRTPIIILTGHGDHALDLEAQRRGAADYLVKGDFGAPLLERVLRYTLERSRTLEALRESEERYALAVRGTNDGLWDWKVSEGTVFFSPRWKAILGYQDHELPNHLDEWHARVHPDDADRVRTELNEHVTGARHHFESEHRMLHRDGTWRWVLMRGLAERDASGQATRLAGSLSDVTQTRAHDPLTGLPNRTLYLDRLERALQRLRRQKDAHFAVLFLDLDRFKVVNDGLGHNVGDELLVGIATRLKKSLRTVDTIARFGGDEFTLLLEDVKQADDAVRVARRLLEELSVPFRIAGREVFSTASIGIALSQSTYARPEEVLRDADTAMYRAKALGKNRYEIFDRVMHEKAIRTLQLESELRTALELHHLTVHYQPIMCLTSGALVGFEALVRWHHPERGLVSPLEFIPLAEETGLVVPLDRWVLRTACLQLKRWHDEFPEHAQLTMSVNTSKLQFDQPDFVDEVDRVLKDAALPASALRLEVTETVVLGNDPITTGMLKRLRERGVHLVVDDFGTGYSSLSYLQRLPFTDLKVDRSFVAHMSQGPSMEIVRAIITLARGLGVKVTAEGVETAAQLDALKELRCDNAQGFLFHKPLQLAEAEALLRARAGAPKAG